MRTEIVSYEQAVKLKEKGFNWPCPYSYSFKSLTDSIHCYDSDPYAPSLYIADKWLRDEKGLYIEIYYNITGWSFNIFDLKNRRYYEHNSLDSYDTYEEALFKGISKALDLI